MKSESQNYDIGVESKLIALRSMIETFAGDTGLEKAIELLESGSRVDFYDQVEKF